MYIYFKCLCVYKLYYKYECFYCLFLLVLVAISESGVITREIDSEQLFKTALEKIGSFESTWKTERLHNNSPRERELITLHSVSI